MHSSFAYAVQLNVGDPWWYVPHVIPELPANRMLLSCMTLDTSVVASLRPNLASAQRRY